MFNSTVLDVAIGLIFTFLAISLAVSAIVEAMASAMKWRSSTLLLGIKDLLNDQKFSGLALATFRCKSPFDKFGVRLIVRGTRDAGVIRIYRAGERWSVRPIRRRTL